VSCVASSRNLFLEPENSTSGASFRSVIRIFLMISYARVRSL
jgi:hypothetical protein